MSFMAQISYKRPNSLITASSLSSPSILLGSATAIAATLGTVALLHAEKKKKNGHSSISDLADYSARYLQRYLQSGWRYVVDAAAATTTTMGVQTNEDCPSNRKVVENEGEEQLSLLLKDASESLQRYYEAATRCLLRDHRIIAMSSSSWWSSHVFLDMKNLFSHWMNTGIQTKESHKLTTTATTSKPGMTSTIHDTKASSIHIPVPTQAESKSPSSRASTLPSQDDTTTTINYDDLQELSVASTIQTPRSLPMLNVEVHSTTITTTTTTTSSGTNDNDDQQGQNVGAMISPLAFPVVEATSVTTDDYQSTPVQSRNESIFVKSPHNGNGDNVMPALQSVVSNESSSSEDDEEEQTLSSSSPVTNSLSPPNIFVVVDPTQEMTRTTSAAMTTPAATPSASSSTKSKHTSSSRKLSSFFRRKSNAASAATNTTSITTAASADDASTAAETASVGSTMTTASTATAATSRSSRQRRNIFGRRVVSRYALPVAMPTPTTTTEDFLRNSKKGFQAKLW